jgi:hypothetical protein
MSYEQLATAVDNLAVVNLALADEVRNTQSTFEASELAAVTAASTAVAAKDVTVAAKDVAVAASNNATAKEALATAAATSADQSEANAAASAAAASDSETTAIANADISTTNKDQAVAAKVAAELARDVAQDAAASLVGVITDRGPIDLSGGVYPPAQTTSSMWKVTVAGTVDGIQYGVGDTLMFTLANDSFYKIDNTEQVSSVAGKTGAVLLDKVDVGLDSVDNTPDVSKPVSSPQQTALNAKIDKTSIVDDLTSTDATKVLSAKQGKSLYDLIQANNVTLVVYEFLATAGQTVFSGVDANGLTLLYTAGTGTIVLRNGVQLEKTVDYTATDGSSVTFVTANDLNDLIQVMAFGTFSVANHYTKAEDDALLATKADKSTTYTKTEDDAALLLKVDKTAVIDVAHGGTGKTVEFRKGYIDGLRLISVGDNAITVTAGSAYIPGLSKIVEMAANKVFTGLATLASQSQHHFYLFESGGVADVEVSLTAPTNYFGSAYNKTGDTTRRYLFSVLSGTTGFYPLRHNLVTGRMSFLTGAPGSAPFAVTMGFGGTSPSLVTTVISNSGAGSIAPRETTTVLHTSVFITAGGQVNVSPADQSVAPGGSNWGETISCGSTAFAPLDVHPSRTSGSVGNYYIWMSSGNVNMYARGYTFER